MNLSVHFTLEELTRSQAALRLGLDNTPNVEQVKNGEALANFLLEPVRALLGVSLHIDSGFRSPMVNQAVGSTAVHSAHLDFLAADVVPDGMDLRKAFDLICVAAPGLPLDQIILECNAWIHLGMAPRGKAPRRQFLLAAGGPGHWSYVSV